MLYSSAEVLNTSTGFTSSEYVCARKVLMDLASSVRVGTAYSVPWLVDRPNE